MTYFIYGCIAGFISFFAAGCFLILLLNKAVTDVNYDEEDDYGH